MPRLCCAPPPNLVCRPGRPDGRLCHPGGRGNLPASAPCGPGPKGGRLGCCHLHAFCELWGSGSHLCVAAPLQGGCRGLAASAGRPTCCPAAKPAHPRRLTLLCFSVCAADRQHAHDRAQRRGDRGVLPGGCPQGGGAAVSNHSSAWLGLAAASTMKGGGSAELLRNARCRAHLAKPGPAS